MLSFKLEKVDIEQYKEDHSPTKREPKGSGLTDFQERQASSDMRQM